MDKKDTKQSFFKMFLHYGKVFYGYAGNKLWLLIGVIFFGGLLEGLGLSLLLPIISFEQGTAPQNAYVGMVFSFLESLNITPTLIALLILMIIVFVLKGSLLFLQQVIRVRVTTQVIKTKRLELAQKYADMKYTYYIEKSVGYLNNAVTTEVIEAVSGFNQFTEVIVTGIYIFVYSIAAFLINWQITLLVFALCSLFFSLLSFLSRISRELSIKISALNAQIQSLLIQSISYFKYLKATNTFGIVHRHLANRIKEHQKILFKSEALVAIPPSLLEPTAVVLLSGLIIFNVYVYGKTISEVVVLLLFFYRAFSRVFQFQVAWQKFNARLGGVEVIKKVNAELDEHKEKQGPRILTHFKEQIMLEAVHFNFGTRPILSNINMSISPNSAVAIVGESGSGKTTILDIISGLLIPQSGTVRFSGYTYQDINLESLRSKIGYVTQEPVIFNDTIANNISLWDDSSLDEVKRRIEDSAKLAHCIEFIGKTENGYDTIIGDKGIKLSVGQRQRIAIARELYKQPSIMIFDEATSALDSESEQLIQQSMVEIMGTRTMIIVAHRLSTVKKCDYIYVVSQGSVIEEGRFDELFDNKATQFARMCEAQRL